MGGIIAVGFLILILWSIGAGELDKQKRQKQAHEKVKQLIKEGHEAEVCPKCKGRGSGLWGYCSECGGMGYTYELNKEKLREKGREN